MCDLIYVCLLFDKKEIESLRLFLYNFTKNFKKKENSIYFRLFSKEIIIHWNNKVEQSNWLELVSLLLLLLLYSVAYVNFWFSVTFASTKKLSVFSIIWLMSQRIHLAKTKTKTYPKRTTDNRQQRIENRFPSNSLDAGNLIMKPTSGPNN